MRVGLGFDAHAFATGRDLVLGGVHVPHDQGLHGHSDADVLSHAIGDAVLGAAGMGDLGEMFPGTEEWKDSSSIVILQHIARAVSDAGHRVVNIDATLIAQGPRMRPHVEAMRANIARALDVEQDAISVKATSTDGMGFTGRAEGIAAMSVALVEPLG